MKNIKQLFKKHREATMYVLDRSSVVNQYKEQGADSPHVVVAAIVATLLGLYFISLL